jgi:uncharacterized protein (DUF1810 family)/ASC-1-like (ASCH) protein
MLHQMKLNAEPFEKMKNGSKTIELRLNDEKRQNVQIGDFIEFSLMDHPREKLQTRVTALHHFASFQALYASLPKEKLGYPADETPDPHHMDAYYAKEEQERYGALGIEIRLTNLQKFIDAQDYGYSYGETYQTALTEIRNGKKNSCWMWYVFPQIHGLGWSGKTAFFSICGLKEAIDYYEHPILGTRLTQITAETLNIKSGDAMEIFGDPDIYKFRSCMTLFKYAAPDNDLFQRALDKFYKGREDKNTQMELGL